MIQPSVVKIVQIFQLTRTQPEKEVNPKSLSVFVRAQHPVAPEVASIRASYIGRKLIDYSDDPAELEHLRSELPEVNKIVHSCYK